MVVLEKISEINEVIKEIFNFLQTNETVKDDFYEYLATIGAGDISLNQMEKVFLPYIFERKINDKSILEIFRENGCKNEKITNSLIDSISSVFEIKRVLKNGFELYNLTNEITYTVFSLTKMTDFRGIYAGQYIVARIFEDENEFYIIEIANVLSHSQKNEALRYAVMKLIQNPALMYFNNPVKEKEINQTICEMYEKFISSFGKDVIYTVNKYADEIIGGFNEGEKIDLIDKGSENITPQFFYVKELDNNYRNFLENSVGGFSSHEEEYDVAIIFDKETGLYAVPFFETFMKIFDNNIEVKNEKECVEYFLKNESVPIVVLDKVKEKYPKFMDKINEIMGTDYTYEELLNKYKPTYLKNKIYSSATVLYSSKVFSDMFEVLSTQVEQPKTSMNEKVGRNEPCPCGSGKKYKNCCGANK
ncbi:MAG: SEC-C domain-containing protein [bacterium]|nr:SEC-C domain-containing protein [bacterium]